MDLKASHTQKVKHYAREAGFMFCGISEARFLEEESRNLETWLNRGYAGKMNYLHNYFDKRLDPRLLVPGAKSVITLGYNYYVKEEHNSGYKVSRYALGEDYHYVVKDKLNALVLLLKETIGEFEGRVFVDSAPVMERAWARNSGTGWIGKNSLLLSREAGSYFFLAEIICDLELVPDGPIKDYCGTCTACMDACPTAAITEPYVVDGSKCISYLTIELKDSIPEEFKGKMNGWIFGCDICQEVCPWNRFATTHSEPRFTQGIPVNFSKNDWEEITEAVFKDLFRLSPLQRTGYKRLKRNLGFLNEEAS